MTTMEQLIELINKIPYKDVVCSKDYQISFIVYEYNFYKMSFKIYEGYINKYFSYSFEGQRIPNEDGERIKEILDGKIALKELSKKESVLQSAINKLKKVLML